MIISPGRNYIFVHIPKTGGTSMALALEGRAKADDILIGDTPKAVKRRGRVQGLKASGRLWKHSKLADIDGLEATRDLDRFFIVTMVRNPWDRMISFYRWARTQRFDHPMIRAAKAHEFREFLKDMDIQRALAADNAARYVTDAKGQMRCNAFIRLENLATDLHSFEAHLGFELGPLPHENATDAAKAHPTYDDDTRQIVANCFADDIARFGYHFPETLASGRAEA